MRNAIKGDLIRLVKDSDFAQIGDVLEVIHVYADGSGVIAKNAHDPNIPIAHNEYVIHRNAGEEVGATEQTQAERIETLCNEVSALLIRKNHDYGDSFSKQYAKYGLLSGLIRMDDKMRRLETLVGGVEAEVDESIDDTLADLAGYALLTLVELRKDQR